MHEYFTALLLFILALGIYTVYKYLRLNVNTSKIKLRMDISRLMNEVSIEYKRYSSSEKFISYPSIEKYVGETSKVFNIISGDINALKSMKVEPVDMENNTEREFFEHLTAEYHNCPDYLRNLVNKQIDLIVEIYIYNHILEYKLYNKSNIIRRIMERISYIVDTNFDNTYQMIINFIEKDKVNKKPDCKIILTCVA